jgi:hypothetical protein
MGLFDKLEKALSKGADIAGDTINKVGEASEGWGERADAWLQQDDKFDKVKEKVTPVANAAKEKATFFAGKAEETVTKVVNDTKEKAAAAKAKNQEDVDYIAEDDVVSPEKADVFVAPVEPETVTVVVVEEKVTPKVTPKVDDFDNAVKSNAQEFLVGEVREPELGDVTAKKKASTKKKAPVSLSALKDEAKALGIKGYSKLGKEDLAKAVKSAKRKAAK